MRRVRHPLCALLSSHCALRTAREEFSSEKSPCSYTRYLESPTSLACAPSRCACCGGLPALPKGEHTARVSPFLPAACLLALLQVRPAGKAAA